MGSKKKPAPFLEDLVPLRWERAEKIWGRQHMLHVIPQGKNRWEAMSLEDRAAAVLEDLRPNVCRECLCSTYFACEGGCSWEESDLCSRCFDNRSAPKKSARKK